MADRFAFLNNLRTAISARSGEPTSGERRSLTLSVTPTEDGADGTTTISTEVQVRSAGDVIAVDPRAIAAVEPRRGSRGFEPNYFPYIDFVDADYPWRFTLDTGERARLQPWLALIALRADEFRFMDRGAGPLPRIEVTNATTSLPDLQRSWATAHVQVNLGDGSGDIRNVLESQPEAHFSRLFCHRQLDSDMRYHAFLVPTFEAGRLAGLGRDTQTDSFGALAWSTGSGAVELPVYTQWHFTTSALEDFESLARRLQPVRADSESGIGGALETFAGEPGYYRNYRQPDETFGAEGALKSLDFERSPRMIQRMGYSNALTNTLNQVIASETLPDGEFDGPDQEDPLVALPAYASQHAQVSSVSLRPRSKRWFHQTNLDPRFRLAAGAGARIVKRHQDAFMHECWEQIGDLLEANQMRQRLAVAAALQDSLISRHFDRMPDNIAIDLIEPVADLVTLNRYARTSLPDDLARNGVPGGHIGLTSRKLVAKRGLTERNGTETAARTAATGLAALSTSSARRVLVPAVSTRQLQVRTLARSALRAGAGILTEASNAQSDAALAEPRSRPRQYQRRIRSASYLSPVRARLKELPVRKSRTLTEGFSGPEANTLEPIVRDVRIPVALGDYLIEDDVDLLMPGVAEMPMNTVALLEENKTFMEAVIAGANHEINREMRWREFPTDMRASVFTRFWDRGQDPTNRDQDDVHALTSWRNTLGRNGRRLSESLVLIIKGDIVRRYPELLVTVNRQTLGGEAWEADEGTDYEPVFGGSINAETRFFGFSLRGTTVERSPDEFFIVLYEPPGRFRFGLDVGTHGTRMERRDLRSSPMPFPVKTANNHTRVSRLDLPLSSWKQAPAGASASVSKLSDLSWSHVETTDAGYIDYLNDPPLVGGRAWGSDRAAQSSNLARAFFQKPMRVVIPATRLVS